LTSLPLICRSFSTYCCPTSMRNSCITRSRPQSARPTYQKRHT
jgi:hypothetical protein